MTGITGENLNEVAEIIDANNERINIQNFHLAKHNLVTEGANGAIHSYVMNNILKFADDMSVLREYCSLVNLRVQEGKLYVSLHLLEEIGGLFIPSTGRSPDEIENFRLFNTDYRNKLTNIASDDFKKGDERNPIVRDRLRIEANVDKMIQTYWTKKSLSNKELIAKGAEFGKDYWTLYLNEYLRCEQRVDPCFKINNLNKDKKLVTDVLISYYNSIITGS